MAVPVYQFGLTVHVVKMVQRTDGVAARYAGADRQIDLTPYLGDSGAVQTTKALGEAAGVFQISFGDQMDPATQDSFYAAIEPMDMVEIRAAREPWQFAGKDLPLIMRGFVSSVRRSESIGDDGAPRRAVVVSGHDMGKLWLIHAVWWELAVQTDKPLLTVLQLQAMLGLKAKLLSANDFMHTMTEQVMNARIAEMEAFTTQLIKPFVCDASVPDGIVLPAMLGKIDGGPYWGIISAFADRPWNELFIQDQEDGPHLVFRPAPFKDINGKLIQDGAADPGTVEVDIADVVQLDVSRSDARVANFYWTPPGASSLLTNSMVTAGSIVDGSAFDSGYGNNKPELFGEKRMDVASALLPTNGAGVPADLTAGQRPAEGQKYVAWYRARAQALQAMNRDNSVFEDGGAALLGRENLVVGKYLRITRGDLTSEAYMTAVSHTFQPMTTWSTTVQLQRGNGFLQRTKVQGAPYFLEGRAGPYGG